MATRTYIRLKHWKEYQHYNNRNPPWVKLYRKLFNSPCWVTLDDADRVLLIASMLLAADTNNKIPYDLAYIQRRAYLHKKPDFQKLIDVEFLELVEEEDTSYDASKMLAKRYHNASNVLANCLPETETDTDTYIQRESNSTNHYISDASNLLASGRQNGDPYVPTGIRRQQRNRRILEEVARVDADTRSVGGGQALGSASGFDAIVGGQAKKFYS